MHRRTRVDVAGHRSHLTAKIAVVTGASKGIGLAITQAFADAGAHVIAGARHHSPELRVLEAAGSATFVAADLATPEGPRALIAAAAERGGVDVLVNNAGAVATRFGGILSVTEEEWDAALSLNFLSAVRFTTAEEVADLTVFLASRRSGNTTGSDVRIDGGYVTTV